MPTSESPPWVLPRMVALLAVLCQIYPNTEVQWYQESQESLTATATQRRRTTPPQEVTSEPESENYEGLVSTPADISDHNEGDGRRRYAKRFLGSATTTSSTTMSDQDGDPPYQDEDGDEDDTGWEKVGQADIRPTVIITAMDTDDVTSDNVTVVAVAGAKDPSF